MCKILVTALALLLLLNANLAAADTTLSTLPKSRSTALTSSLLCTLVPAALGGALLLSGSNGGQTDNAGALAGLAIGSAGIVLGPGMGHAYAGRTGRFWKGVAIRGAVVALTAAISFSASENSLSISDGIEQASMTLAVGTSICLGCAIYDIFNVGTSVDDYNKEHGFSGLTLRPTYFSANKAPGLMLSMSF